MTDAFSANIGPDGTIAVLWDIKPTQIQNPADRELRDRTKGAIKLDDQGKQAVYDRIRKFFKIIMDDTTGELIVKDIKNPNEKFKPKGMIVIFYDEKISFINELGLPLPKQNFDVVREQIYSSRKACNGT